MRKRTRPALAVALTMIPCPGRRHRAAPRLALARVIVNDVTKFNLEGHVTSVESTGPAHAAGVLRHDIIVAVDDKTALNTREITCLIHDRRPGTWYR